MTPGAPTPVPRTRSGGATPTGIWRALRTASTPTDTALVAVGGAAGAVARWGVLSVTDSRAAFPWPTLLVNVVGCFVVGVLTTSPRSAQMLAGVGFAGGLTTFSTFAVETADLLDGSEVGTGLGYVAASAGAGLIALVLGRTLGGRRC